MAKDPRHIRGSWGEVQAAHFLEKNGYRLLEKNWKAGKHEIDIICKRGNLLVFFEIKTRTKGSLWHDVELVSPAQQKRIWQAAENYMFEIDFHGEIRFDVLRILLENKQVVQIAHFKDAFFPEWE